MGEEQSRQPAQMEQFWVRVLRAEPAVRHGDDPLLGRVEWAVIKRILGKLLAR